MYITISIITSVLPSPHKIPTIHTLIAPKTPSACCYMLYVPMKEVVPQTENFGYDLLLKCRSWNSNFEGVTALTSTYNS